MSTTDQLQSCLTFTDTALAHNKDALAINIDQYAVNGNTGCQLFCQLIDQLCCKTGCGITGSKNRDSISRCQFQELFFRLKITTKDHTRNIIAQKLPVMLMSMFFRHMIKIGIFYCSDNLYTFLLKMFKKSRHLQCRTIDIRQFDKPCFKVYTWCEIFQS